METYYVYDYFYEDSNYAKTIKNSATKRRYDDNSFYELTKIKMDHLDPLLESQRADFALWGFETLIIQEVGLDNFISVSDWNDKELWDLYESNFKKHQEEINKIEVFNLIDRLQVTDYNTETYNRCKTKEGRGKQNKYIYFLKKDDIIVYVGQTKAVEMDKCNRPNQHTDKDFDYFDIIQLDDEDDINVVEAFYIMKHKPFYNKALSVSSEMMLLFKYIFKTDWDPYKNRK